MTWLRWVDKPAPLDITRILDWGGGPNHKLHAMTSSETSKEEFFEETSKEKFCRGKDIVEWKIRSRGLVLARN